MKDGQELLERLHGEVEKLVEGSDWKRMLDLANQVHSYSFGNLLLIAMQRPDATMVMGYRKWEANDRHVMKGEKGIRILAPIIVKKEDETGKEVRKLVGFKGVAVFDISQTEGEPFNLPEVKLLEGEGPEGALEAIVRLIEAQGFTFARGSCFGGANGTTDFLSREVTVRADVSGAQALKTAIHELAHVMLHDPDGSKDEAFQCRGQKEVEAESVAYVVAAKLGLETDGYSFPYVATWAGRQEDSMKVVQASGTRVLKAAGQIIESLTETVTEAVAA